MSEVKPNSPNGQGHVYGYMGGYEQMHGYTGHEMYGYGYGCGTMPMGYGYGYANHAPMLHGYHKGCGTSYGYSGEAGDPWVRFSYCSFFWSLFPKQCLSNSQQQLVEGVESYNSVERRRDCIGAFGCPGTFYLKVNMEKHPEPNSGCLVYVFNLLKNK